MNYCLDDLFKKFVRERIYLKNVTDDTVYFYWQAWRAFKRVHTKENIEQADLNEFLIFHKENGVKAVSVNTYSRALNAFFNWAYQSQYLPERFKVPKLKEEKTALKTVSNAHLCKVVKFKPRTFSEQRLSVLLQLLIDTGIRINEALTLEIDKVDFDNLLMTVKGKGNKERIIPFSFEMRKVLYRYVNKFPGSLVFATKQGGKLDYNIIKRDYYELCKRLGLKDKGFHRFRHTFAVEYIKNGGSLFGLQKILGHSDLSVTKMYVELQIDDLIIEHKKTTQLARLKS